MQDNIKPSGTNKEDEIDLGVFFNLIGIIISRINKTIKNFFVGIFQFLLLFLLFLKRKFLWLVLGALIGFATGLFFYIKKGPTYSSEMIVRANFESSRVIYNQVNYFNSLIKENRIDILKRILKISEKEAASLVSFSVSPVKDNLEVARLYKSTFLESPKRREKESLRDSLWSKTVKFEKFKEELEPYDYPLQKIKLLSTDPFVFQSISKSVINNINSNDVIQDVKNNTLAIYNEEISLLNRALSGLDSLRQVYNKRISGNGLGGFDKSSSIVVSENQLRNPEVELFDKELILKDELIEAKRSSLEQQEIIRVISDFNVSGTKQSSFEQDFFKFTWIGLAISFGFLLIIELLKFLRRVEQSKI